MIALTVTLRVRNGRVPEFLDAIEKNALDSFSNEPGCVHFDVNQDLADDHEFVFYELYESEEAVAAHRATPHFAAWREAADRLIEPGSQVNRLARTLVHHASAKTPHGS